MIRNFICYVYQGWCNDNASWLNVFVSLLANGAACFLLFFILFGWMIFVFNN